MTTRISNATRERIALAWPAILDALAEGDLVRETLKAHDISPQEMRCYRTTTDGAQADWEAARKDSADALMDEAMAEARASYGKHEAAHVRTRIDTLKWAARIHNPQVYSDKAQLDVNMRHTVDLSRIIDAANARLVGARAMPAVTHNSSVDDVHARMLLAAPLPALADLL